ncbi:peptide ABC transporter permease [Aureimonas altamirensis]|uniref:Peptide ABC transporter permease n=1 Tax=Aureimonas altamirensis TaxID=370622 RepID=A0A0B1Q9P0_9HYPH|nr:ABC transporter permease [Aureimonas altamirensis]KHJ56091.1 peptide ABC transporter permease [Aureimonas altamirensis]
MRRIAIGLALLVLVAATALLSFAWTPDPTPLRLDIPARLTPPGATALLGTDQLGRDTASMVMMGAASSLSIALTAVALGGLAGSATGLFAALRGGAVAGLTMRVMDILFAFPPVLSALLLAFTLGAGPQGAVAAIALFVTPVFARVAHAGAAQVMRSDFVRAARALGAGDRRIAARHVLPNIGGLLAVQASLQFGLAILTEAGLGYLGLGTQPPSPSWGRMLADSQSYLGVAPWLALAPGAAIAVTVLGANILGDGLAERLDPRGKAPR